MPPKSKKMRLQLEIEQFYEKDYMSEFKKVEPVSENSVKVTDYQNNIWTVIRDQKYLQNPPQIFKNGEEIVEDSWSPALTSAKWLLMMMHQECCEAQ